MMSGMLLAPKVELAHSTKSCRPTRVMGAKSRIGSYLTLSKLTLVAKPAMVPMSKV